MIADIKMLDVDDASLELTKKIISLGIIPNVDKPQPNRNDLTLKQRDASHQASESS